MSVQRIWPWRDRSQQALPRRRFKKAWWGGWWTRLALLLGASGFLALGRASSWQEGVRVGLLFAAFYTSLMILGWLNNYVELEATGVKISQMGIVTPGGPTYGGGRIAFADVVGVTFIQPRSIHISYNGKDWRRRPTVRTTKLYLEHADEFVEGLAAGVQAATGTGLNIERRG